LTFGVWGQAFAGSEARFVSVPLPNSDASQLAAFHIGDAFQLAD
jgi:hypothetical protein